MSFDYFLNPSQLYVQGDNRRIVVPHAQIFQHILLVISLFLSPSIVLSSFYFIFHFFTNILSSYLYFSLMFFSNDFSCIVDYSILYIWDNLSKVRWRILTTTQNSYLKYWLFVVCLYTPNMLSTFLLHICKYTLATLYIIVDMLNRYMLSSGYFGVNYIFYWLWRMIKVVGLHDTNRRL